ncbi:MAG TPA: hypothetical protein VGB66_13750 [Longimicrobium sp.]|jgi:hypothetical protein
MIRNAEHLRPGDSQERNGRRWVVEAAEMQDGMMQVLWRCGDERRWDEFPPGVPVVVSPGESAERLRRVKQASDLVEGDRLAGPGWPPYEAAAVEREGTRIVVEWTNGSALRVKEYDPGEGVLVETLVTRPGTGGRPPS